VVATAAVPHLLNTTSLDHHAAGDWGDLDAYDKADNEEAARTANGRLFSSYATTEHGTIWVHTNAIRGEVEGPITTVLSPDDYPGDTRAHDRAPSTAARPGNGQPPAGSRQPLPRGGA